MDANQRNATARRSASNLKIQMHTFRHAALDHLQICHARGDCKEHDLKRGLCRGWREGLCVGWLAGMFVLGAPVMTAEASLTDTLAPENAIVGDGEFCENDLCNV